jgi:hypothetical protein
VRNLGWCLAATDEIVERAACECERWPFSESQHGLFSEVTGVNAILNLEMMELHTCITTERAIAVQLRDKLDDFKV